MGAPLRLFNTLGRRLEDFHPLGPEVRMYSCGPTVYSYQHIGNLRAYVFADTLRRVLEWKGLRVRHVVNITDVGHLTSDADEGEDKVEAAARAAGETIGGIVGRYTDAFLADLEAMRVEPPALWARASEHVPEMIEFIRRLEDRGYTYLLESGLYFDTTRTPDYGKLALLDREGLIEGARVAPTPGKRTLTDFALWRRTPPGTKALVEWESPWGPGIPGWHIECSTMSIEYLGDHFDIHTGGVDHIPVHHTNEIAQSEAYLGDGRDWVAYWLHNEFINLDDAKMSKSRGEVVLLRDLEERGYHPLVYRRLLLGAHYRNQMSFTWEGLEDARVGLRRLLERLRGRVGGELPGEPTTLEEVGPLSTAGRRVLDEFDEAVSTDLNTARGLALVTDASRDPELTEDDFAQLLPTFERVLALGFLDLDPEALELPADTTVSDAEVEELVAARNDARGRGDYAAADEIRRQLVELGVELRDTKNGTTWRLTSARGGGR